MANASFVSWSAQRGNRATPPDVGSPLPLSLGPQPGSFIHLRDQADARLQIQLQLRSPLHRRYQRRSAIVPALPVSAHRMVFAREFSGLRSRTGDRRRMPTFAPPGPRKPCEATRRSERANRRPEYALDGLSEIVRHAGQPPETTARISARSACVAGPLMASVSLSASPVVTTP
jgi:hypothetical protein